MSEWPNKALQRKKLPPLRYGNFSAELWRWAKGKMIMRMSLVIAVAVTLQMPALAADTAPLKEVPDAEIGYRSPQEAWMPYGLSAESLSEKKTSGTWQATPPKTQSGQ